MGKCLIISPSIADIDNVKGYIMTKKITAAELGTASDQIVKSSAALAIVAVIPDIVAFERVNGAFTAAQRNFISRAFKEIAMNAIGLHAQALNELLLKFESNELELEGDMPAENITGDPDRFEELLRQFGGIKGSA